MITLAAMAASGTVIAAVITAAIRMLCAPADRGESLSGELPDGRNFRPDKTGDSHER